jgi:hypothetical protein
MSSALRTIVVIFTRFSIPMPAAGFAPDDQTVATKLTPGRWAVRRHPVHGMDVRSIGQHSGGHIQATRPQSNARGI